MCLVFYIVLIDINEQDKVVYIYVFDYLGDWFIFRILVCGLFVVCYLRVLSLVKVEFRQ